MVTFTVIVHSGESAPIESSFISALSTSKGRWATAGVDVRELARFEGRRSSAIIGPLRSSVECGRHLTCQSWQRRSISICFLIDLIVVLRVSFSPRRGPVVPDGFKLAAATATDSEDVPIVLG